MKPHQLQQFHPSLGVELGAPDVYLLTKVLRGTI
jgi:hypothetical protein